MCIRFVIIRYCNFFFETLYQVSFHSIFFKHSLLKINVYTKLIFIFFLYFSSSYFIQNFLTIYIYLLNVFRYFRTIYIFFEIFLKKPVILRVGDRCKARWRSGQTENPEHYVATVTKLTVHGASLKFSRKALGESNNVIWNDIEQCRAVSI